MGEYALPSDLVQRTRWYINLRWFLILIICGSGIIPLWVGEGWNDTVKKDVIIASIGIATNVVFYALGRLNRSKRYYAWLAASLVALDTFLVTYAIYSNGGLESRALIIYTMPMLVAAAIFGRLALYITAVGVTLIYDLMILGDYFGWIHAQGKLTSQSSDLSYVIYTVIFYSSLFMLYAFLADYITKLLTTKERQATAAANELKRAQSLAKIGSWEWDIYRNIISWSPEFISIFAPRQHKDPNYSVFLELVHEADKDFVNQQVQLALKKCAKFNFDYRIISPGKGLRYVHAEGEVATNKKGEPVKVYGTARDITEERELEKAKGDFVSLASHQLRTPATGVKVMLALLKDGYAGELTEKQNKLLSQAYEANDRQLQIANDLLTVARVESGRLSLRKREVDMQSWLKRSLGELRQNSEKRNQQLTVILPGHPVKLVFDPERMYMVIDNLLDNASKYTQEGGLLTVTLKDSKTRTTIQITDTGVGIAPKDVRKLFHKFSRLDSDLTNGTEGTGLGLYLAENIVKLHNGTINVRSKIGKGTTFTIIMPKSVAPKPAKAKAKAISPARRSTVKS